MAAVAIASGTVRVVIYIRQVNIPSSCHRMTRSNHTRVDGYIVRLDELSRLHPLLRENTSASQLAQQFLRQSAKIRISSSLVKVNQGRCGRIIP